MGETEPMGPFTCIHGAYFAADPGFPLDQVKRRQQFEAAYPDWRITWDGDYRVFRAWRLLNGGENNLTRYKLGDLMDALEALEAPPAALAEDEEGQ